MWATETLKQVPLRSTFKKSLFCSEMLKSKFCKLTVEPRYNESAGDRPNLFVKSRVRYIKNLDITNFRGNDQNVRYIEVIVND